MPTPSRLRQIAQLTICAAGMSLAAGCGGGSSGTTLPPVKQTSGTALAPDEYQTSKFRPETKFKVDAGWETTSPELRDYFDIARRNAFQAITFQRVKQVAVATHPISDNYAPVPPDLVAWIRTHPRLNAGKPVKATVGGEDATRIDAQVRSTPKKNFPGTCDRPCLPLFVPSDERPVTFERGDRVRFLVVDNGVTITVAAPASQFESFLPKAQKVISSVDFK
jgi:hypothetical protein